ncbi:hypothetical protein M3Y94_00841600 [Aphelenchoides besseyi]|nr:hypothetical protein M3Y94_00841600 [Aphelenchoides besseyi]KAI6226917.1 hypothetical protein M3Y95_00671800 [Aphelenchoides besseyi]
MFVWSVFYVTVTCFCYSISALSEEFEFVSSDKKFVLEGFYDHGHFTGKEFWLCVDYDSLAREETKFDYRTGSKKKYLTRLLQKRAGLKTPFDVSQLVAPNQYPSEKCGGQMRSTQNAYWYALHGIWRSERVLEMRFVSAYELWTETSTPRVKVRPIDHDFPWNRNVLKSANPFQWKLVQSHGVVINGQQKPTISLLDLIGSGNVYVPAPLQSDSTIHVRLNGHGIRLKSLSIRPRTVTVDDFSSFYEELKN